MCDFVFKIFRFTILITKYLLQVKRVGATFYTCMFFIFSFIMLKVFPIMLFAFGVHGLMVLSGGILAVGFIFTLFVVRETKGIYLDVLEDKDNNKF